MCGIKTITKEQEQGGVLPDIQRRSYESSDMHFFVNGRLCSLNTSQLVYIKVFWPGKRQESHYRNDIHCRDGTCLHNCGIMAPTGFYYHHKNPDRAIDNESICFLHYQEYGIPNRARKTPCAKL